MHDTWPRHRPVAVAVAVVGVDDPGGGGSDGAHTVGLAGRAGYELYLPARPTLGTDPGADWRFSPRDLAGLLHDLAGAVLRGGLRPGSSVAETVDAGLTRVVLTLRPTVQAPPVGAAQLPPRCAVVPVDWLLDRPRSPSRPPVTSPWGAETVRARVDTVSAATATLLAQARERGVAAARLPDRWGRPAPTEIPGGRELPFGPLHELVVARAAQVLQADGVLLGHHLRLLGLGALAGVGPSTTLGPLDALARRSGRSPAVAAIHREAPALVDVLVGTWARTTRWSSARRSWLAGFCPEHRREEGVRARGLLLDGVDALLTAEALQDVAPDPPSAAVLAAAAGPWRWAASGGTLPDPLWAAPSEAVQVVRALLAGVDGPRLARAGAALRAAAGEPSFRSAHDRLLGLTATGAGAGGAHDPAVDDLRLIGLDGEQTRDALEVEVVLVPAVARARPLGHAAWHALTRPVRRELPHLPREPPDVGAWP